MCKFNQESLEIDCSLYLQSLLSEVLKEVQHQYSVRATHFPSDCLPLHQPFLCSLKSEFVSKTVCHVRCGEADNSRRVPT